MSPNPSCCPRPRSLETVSPQRGREGCTEALGRRQRGVVRPQLLPQRLPKVVPGLGDTTDDAVPDRDECRTLAGEPLAGLGATYLR